MYFSNPNEIECLIRVQKTMFLAANRTTCLSIYFFEKKASCLMHLVAFRKHRLSNLSRREGRQWQQLVVRENVGVTQSNVLPTGKCANAIVTLCNAKVKGQDLNMWI